MSDKENKQHMPNVEELEERSRSTDRILLIKAKEDAKRRVRDDPTAANVAALEKIESLLAKMSQKPAEKVKIYRSCKAVLAYAKECGRQISQPKIYKDIENGLLARQVDGTFLQPDVDRYLATVSPKGASAKQIEAAWKRQEEKDALELRRLLAKTESDELDLAVKRGEYIAKDKVYQELAARAATLAIGLKSVFEAQIGELIEKLEGNPKRAMDGLNFLNSTLDNALNEYSRDMEFEEEIPE